jgi:surface antigen
VEEWGMRFPAPYTIKFAINKRLQRRLRSGYLVVITILVSSMVIPFVHIGRAAAGSDDYPSDWKNKPMDSVFDSWGEYNRECTSFVAWRLSSQNGYTMPFHDSAVNWAADAKARGITVDSSPAKGAVAYKGNHVAWVESVSSDKGKVTVEEYNEIDSNGNGMYADDGTYSERTVPYSSFQYIHFKDIGAKINSSAYANKLIRSGGGTIAFVANNGLRYWAPTMSTVNCLGGTTTQLSDAAFNSIPSSTFAASCNTKYVDRMIRSPSGTISYTDSAALQHWVPSMSIVNCLSASGSIMQLDNNSFTGIGGAPTAADCLSRYVDRTVHSPNGTVSYVDINEAQHWVPNSATIDCLGGWSAMAEIDSDNSSSLSSATTANCPVIYFGRMVTAPSGTVAYLSSNGYLHWVANGDIVNCLGGWGATINVDWDTFNQFSGAENATCATR